MSLTTLVGTVRDSDNIVWANASWVARLLVPGGPQKAVFKATGLPVVTNVAGKLDASGVFSGQVADCNSILPNGCQWQFSIAPLTSSPEQTIPAEVITGSSSNVGPFVSAHILAPRIQSSALVYAYDAIEVINPVNGNGYTNTTSNGSFMWNGSAWVSLGGGGSGSVLNGNAVALAFYPSTGTTVQGTAGLVTDATGVDFAVPRNAFVNNLTNSSEVTLAGPYAGVSFSQQVNNTPNVIGTGWSQGTLGGWTVTRNNAYDFTCAVRGISTNLASTTFNHHAIGDTAGIYLNTFSDGGPTAGGDEGCTAATFQITEPLQYFHGTINTTTGKGDIQPTLNFTSGNGWTTDGAFLLNISKGTIAGNLAGVSTAFGGFLNQFPITGVSLPLTKTYGRINAPISNPLTTRNTPILTSVTLTLLPVGGVIVAFSVNDVVTVAGAMTEQSIVSSASAITAGNQQTLGLHLCNPNPDAMIFTGGIQGQYISFDANLSVSGMRSTYYACGSLTGTDLIYLYNVGGGIDVLQADGAQNFTTSGAGSGFHLYPGAEVVANTSLGAAPTLEQNGVVWASGDTVENPHYSVWGGNALFIVKNQSSPTATGLGSVGIALNMQGAGIAGAQCTAFFIQNLTPDITYAPTTNLIPPNFIVAQGEFSNCLSMNRLPTEGLFVFAGTSAGDIPIITLTEMPNANFIYDFAAQSFGFGDLSVGNHLTAFHLDVAAGGDLTMGTGADINAGNVFASFVKAEFLEVDNNWTINFPGTFTDGFLMTGGNVSVAVGDVIITAGHLALPASGNVTIAGTLGFSGTVASPTSITVVGGIVTDVH